MLALIKKVFIKPAAAKKTIDTLYVQWHENNKVVTVSFHATVNGPHVYSFTCRDTNVMKLGFGRMAGLQGMSPIRKLVSHSDIDTKLPVEDMCYNWMRIRGYK